MASEYTPYYLLNLHSATKEQCVDIGWGEVLAKAPDRYITVVSRFI